MAKKKRSTRAGRDVAGVGPDVRQTRHLTPLRELKKFRVASGEPDIRGWPVFTSSGRELGDVEDLLVDTTRGEVVMLDIDMRGTDRHSLAPLRAAWIDRATKRVVLDGAQFNADEEFPSLSRTDTLSDDDVKRFGDRYRSTYGDRALAENEDLRLRHKGDELRFGRRASDDVVVERRPLPADDPDWQRPEDESADWRDVRLAQPESGKVVEEVVVRRRVVDPTEADRVAREEKR
ncbi:MAG TPA: PRC-barrel domain-containing protein [Gemmatimonadaceae bacterium]|nr:PRC-barrel domain-containing protein [Gemmatimonadaceae bacterium]